MSWQMRAHVGRGGLVRTLTAQCKCRSQRLEEVMMMRKTLSNDKAWLAWAKLECPPASDQNLSELLGNPN